MSSTSNYFSLRSLNVYHGALKDELISFVRDTMDDTSVFCFQETDKEIREAFDNILLGEFVHHHITKPADDVDDYNQSTYIRRNIEVVSVTSICTEQDGTGLALKCEIIDSDGRYMTITNVHGTPRPGHKLDTPERLKLSRKLIDSTRDSGGIQVIMGDFNLLPEAESVKMFAAHGFRDLIQEFGIITTRNKLAWQRYPKNMKQLFADYTFVRGSSEDYNFSVENVMVSDHLPMTLEILP